MSTLVPDFFVETDWETECESASFAEYSCPNCVGELEERTEARYGHAPEIEYFCEQCGYIPAERVHEVPV